ncbi:hypothetical protein [Streptomyces sp. NPDC049916]|uniref:hypothetical protein n=1 Tax=Streptomyces sp. NPDC049916 TaxID=3155156 RepID=UPI003426E8D7
MPAVDRVLLDRHLLARLRDNGWWSPAVIGTLALALALLVWWFAHQLVVGTPRWVETRSTGVRLRRRAWERALTTQVVAIDTVARARVRLVGRPIRAAVIVTVEPEARPTEVLRGVARVIADARVSGGIPGLPADVRVRVANRPGRRAR